MDVIKNILGALFLLVCGIVAICFAIAVFGAIIGFVTWIIFFAVPEMIITIVGFILVAIVIVGGFCFAYQIVDDYRHNRW